MTRGTEVRRPFEAVIARPISERDIITVPVTPLFQDRMPYIQGRWSRPEPLKQLDVVIGNGPVGPDERTSLAIISSDGSFAHNRSSSILSRDIRSKILAGEGLGNEDFIYVYGHPFSGRSRKGDNFSNVRLEMESFFSLRAHGLMTSSEAEQIIKGAERLKNLGISSEVILGVYRLDMLPIVTQKQVPGSNPPEYARDVQLVTPDEYKKWLLGKVDEYNKEIPRRKRVFKKIYGLHARHFLRKKIDFVVVERATTVPFRLSDLTLPFKVPDRYPDKQGPMEDFVFMMNYAISYINRAKGYNLLPSLRAPQDGSDMANQEYNRERVLQFFDYFASNLGHQVATLHRRNLDHQNLHSGNILIDGSICDVGTIGFMDRGAVFTAGAEDVRRSLYSICSSLNTLSQAGIISQEQSVGIGKHFLQNYINTRYGSDNNAAASRLRTSIRLEIFDTRPKPEHKWAHEIFREWIKPVLEN